MASSIFGPYFGMRSSPLACLAAALACVCGTACSDDGRSDGGITAAASGTGGIAEGASGTAGVAPGAGAGAGASTGGSASGTGAPSTAGSSGMMPSTMGASGQGGGNAGGTGANADGGMMPADGGAAMPEDLAPIDPPVADDCITDVSPGDHTFTCQGITFLTMVDELCTQRACGLILDAHGATMSGAVMRTNNRLHELAPPQGYIAVQPTAPSGTWDFAAHPAIMADFIERMIAAFHMNTRRIHVTGFSMGAGVTFWFLCNRPDLVASTGPVTGSSADQVRIEGTDMSCIEALDADWQPRVPILFMSGTSDGALTIEAARARTEGLVSRLGLTGGDEIDGDGSYRRKRWTGDGGMVLDFLEHDYSGVVAGHCIPGPTPDAIYGCTSGDVTLDWGKTILEWFIEHPKP